MLYCETGKFQAVCAGLEQMQQIDTDVLELAIDLAPDIKAIKEKGQIVLMVQHGWVSAIEATKRRFRSKLHTAD